MSNPVLTRLLAQRQEQVDFITHLLEQVETENRDLVDAERSNVEAARQRITQLDAQIEPLEAFEATRSAHEETRSNVTPTRPRGDRPKAPTGLGIQSREVKYRSPGEFVVDYLRARGMTGGQELAQADIDARQRVEASLGRSLNVEERVVAAGVTGDVPGLLPASIIGEILSELDGARPLVSSVGAKPLGDVVGTSFNRPYVSQHTDVDKQTAEHNELPSRALKILNLAFAKNTFGGALKVSRQQIDWSSPTSWDQIVKDLQLVYGMETEDWAASVLQTGLTQNVNIAKADGDKLPAWITALYSAAQQTATAGGTRRATTLRLADTIWTSVDMWAKVGAIIDSAAITGGFQRGGSASPAGFAGSILDIPRIMVPGLSAGKVIVGNRSMFEFYEERIGLLQAISPASLGVEVAYGGYAAAGRLDTTAFSTITVLAV